MKCKRQAADEEASMPLLPAKARPTAEKIIAVEGPSWTSVMLLLTLLALGAILLFRDERGVFARALESVLQRCESLGGPKAAALMATATFLANAFGIPALGLYIGSGVIFARLYGPVWGTVVGSASVFAGAWAGSLACFLVARMLLRERAEKWLRSTAWLDFDFIWAVVEEDGWKFVFLARLSPLIPAEAFNYGCAVTPISLAGYAVGCIGSLPLIILWVWSSASVSQLARLRHQSAEERHSLVAMVVGNVVVAIGLAALGAEATRRCRARLEAGAACEAP